MMFTLGHVGGLDKNGILLGVGVWGVRDCSASPIFMFFIKNIEFAPRPEIMLSQTLIIYH